MYDFKLYIYDIDKNNQLLKKVGVQVGDNAVFGSAKSANIFINKNTATLSSAHVRVMYKAKGSLYLLNSCGHYQTFINGVLMKDGEGRVLKHGDKIQMCNRHQNNEQGILLVVTKPFFEHDVNTKSDVLNKLKQKNKITIGRNDSCDIVLRHMAVSNFHASIEKTRTGKYIVRDLESTNGTYVDGRKISSYQEITESSKVYVGKYVISLKGDAETNQSGVTAIHDSLAIVTQAIEKEYRNKKTGAVNVALKSTDLRVTAGTLLGLMGPSGCGKSTLLKSLNGDTPPTRGDVFLFNLNLLDNYDYLKTQIGYVPQDDTIHRNLKVDQCLYYTAKLRLSNPNNKEINERIDNVLKSLNIDNVRDKYVSELSGGQRKRLCVANELLTSPTLLFLDEPTSPLDPKNIEDFLGMLRKLSKDYGTTVVMVTHKPEDLQYMDEVIFMAEGGDVVYHGDKDEYMQHFNVKSPVSVYPLISDNLASQWVNKWKQINPPISSTPSINNSTFDRENNKPFFFQLYWLTLRNLMLKFNDKNTSRLMLVQAPIIAILVCFIFPDISISLLFIVALSSIWFGTNNAAREIVAEQSIFKRERMFNLDIWPYVLSKLLVLSLFSVAQSFLFVLIIGVYFAGSDVTLNDPIFVFFWITLLSLAATVLGLLISSLGKTVESVLSVVPIVLIPQIMLAGIVTKITTWGVEVVSYLTLSRWGTEGLAIIQQDIINPLPNPIQGETLDAVNLLRSKFHEEYAETASTTISTDLIIVLLMMCIMLILTRVALKNKDSVSL